MPTRPPREPFNALVLAAFAVVITAVLIAAGGGDRSAPVEGLPSWQGLAGAQRPRVAVGQRVIVVLKAPALADRVGRAGDRHVERVVMAVPVGAGAFAEGLFVALFAPVVTPVAVRRRELEAPGRVEHNLYPNCCLT